MRIVDDVELVDGDRIDGIAPGALESLAQIATIADCAAARAIDGQREFVARPWLVIDEAEAKLFDETARFAGGTSHPRSSSDWFMVGAPSRKWAWRRNRAAGPRARSVIALTEWSSPPSARGAVFCGRAGGQPRIATRLWQIEGS